MTRNPRQRDDDETNEADEGPSEADIQRFSDATRTCPDCSTEVYDDAALCWKCGSAMKAKQSSPPAWAIIVAMVLAGLFLFMAFRWAF